MHPHRVDVFDRAHDDAIVFSVAHDLHLEFLPADHRLLDQQLVRGRRFQPALADGDEFLAVVGDAAARPPEGERRPDHGRKTDRRLNLQCLLQRMRERRARAGEPYPRHGLLEFFAVLGLVDRLAARAYHLDPVLLQNAVPNQVQRAIEPRLAAHGRQQRIGPLPGDDGLQHLPVHRLDVGDIGHVRVSHDGRWIRIHQDHLVVFGAQRLAGLRTGIVEFAGLADDDGARPDDEDALDVGALRHCGAPASALRSDRRDTRCRAARGSLRGAPGSRTPAGRCVRSPAGCRRRAIRGWS